MHEKSDAHRVCAALREVLKESGKTQEELGKLIGEAQQNVGRIMNGREPKPSEIIKIERALRRTPGTVYSKAGLCARPTDLEAMLGSDPRLIPEFQQLAVESYAVWVRLSNRERN